MSFTNNYPNVIKNFSDEAHNEAIQQATAILRVGKLKVRTAIATAIRKAKKTIAEKRINNVKIYYI